MIDKYSDPDEYGKSKAAPSCFDCSQVLGLASKGIVEQLASMRVYQDVIDWIDYVDSQNQILIATFFKNGFPKPLDPCHL